MLRIVKVYQLIEYEKIKSLFIAIPSCTYCTGWLLGGRFYLRCSDETNKIYPKEKGYITSNC